MAIVNGYATLPEAKGWVGISDAQDDALIEDIVTAVSRRIDNYCRGGGHFWASADGVARRFDSTDGVTVELGDASAVTAVKTDENQDGTFETTWAASDYQLLPLNVLSPEPRSYVCLRAASSRQFPMPRYLPGRSGLVEVTGTWGWPSVPQVVNQACRMQVSRLLQRRKSPEGVSGWGDFGAVRISRLDPDVQMLLDDYRLDGVAVTTPRLVDIVGALGEQLNSIEGLRIHDHVPGTTEYPAAFILPPTIDYRQAFRTGFLKLELEVVVLVSAAVDRMQRDVFGYIDWAGPQSIAAAINNDMTLGLAGINVVGMEARTLGLEEVAGYQAWGAAVRITIGVTNTN